MNQVRWGVLGTAKITQAEVGPAMNAASRSRIQAIGSRRLDAARALADELGAPDAYGSYEEVLAAPDVDAVYIPLPNTMHREWTLAALAAGKHVLCEKPMGLDAAEVEEMADAARAAGRVLMEGFMWRFHPKVRHVLDLIDDGAVGDVRLVRATYTFDLAAAADVRAGRFEDDIRLDPARGGGALTDLGSYCVNGLRTYARSTPAVISSDARRGAGREVETQISGELQFENGVVGQFFAALDVPGGGHVEILGTRGRIRLPNAFRTRRAQGPVLIERQDADGTWSTEELAFADQYELELDQFADVVLDGAAPVVTLEDSVENARTLELIRRSWHEGAIRASRV